MELVSEFYNHEPTQKYYAERVRALIDELKLLYSESFKLKVFLPKVQEVVRCEIAIRHYSKMIANGEEKDDTKQRLRDERMREAALWEQLGLKMAGIERSKRDRHTEDADNFEDHIMNMMKGVDPDELEKDLYGDDEEEEEEEKETEEVEDDARGDCVISKT